VKRIDLGITVADSEVMRKAIIRSELAVYVDVVKDVIIFVMKNSKKKCRYCGKKAFIKVTAKTWNDKLFSVYYCLSCFLEKLEEYLKKEISHIKEQILEYAKDELVAEEI